VSKEYYQFKDKNKVMEFLKDYPHVLDLYNSLPKIIGRVFGEVKVALSIYEDDGWRQLKVDIRSGHKNGHLSAREDRLFELLGEDNFSFALEFVTICFEEEEV
jgi:hypothetical protein